MTQATQQLNQLKKENSKAWEEMYYDSNSDFRFERTYKPTIQKIGQRYMGMCYIDIPKGGVVARTSDWEHDIKKAKIRSLELAIESLQKEIERLQPA
jgi:hypothetical protein